MSHISRSNKADQEVMSVLVIAKVAKGRFRSIFLQVVTLPSPDSEVDWDLCGMGSVMCLFLEKSQISAVFL